MSLHSVDPDSFNSDSFVHSSGHSLQRLPRHLFRCLYLAVWTTAIRFCMEWPRTSWGESSRCRCRSMPHHRSQTSWPHNANAVSAALASSSAASGVQTHLSVAPGIVRSNAYVVRTWLMISISSPKATDNSFGLPLITCVRCHERTTASETEALALPVREFGTVCHVACEHLTSATNILKHYWRHICLTRPRRFVTFYILSALEILLITYFLTYLHLWQELCCFRYELKMYWF